MTTLTSDELANLDNMVGHIGDSPIFVDGGGGHGEWTAEALKRHPNARVYLFEPNPTNFALCKERFREQHNVYLTNAALWSDYGTLTFWVDPDVHGFGSSLYRREHHFDHPIHVNCIPLRDIVGDGVQVDFVKLDLEGSELEAIKGLGSLRPARIQFEFGGTWLDAGTSIDEAYRLLDSLGYDIEQPMPPEYEFHNILAVMRAQRSDTAKETLSVSTAVPPKDIPLSAAPLPKDPAYSARVGNIPRPSAPTSWMRAHCIDYGVMSDGIIWARVEGEKTQTFDSYEEAARHFGWKP